MNWTSLSLSFYWFLVVGTCLFAYGLKQGELCRRDNDCETGLLCQETGEGRTCQPPLSNKKQYSEYWSGFLDFASSLVSPQAGW